MISGQRGDTVLAHEPVVAPLQCSVVVRDEDVGEEEDVIGLDVVFLEYVGDVLG